MTSGRFRIVEGGAAAQPKRKRPARESSPFECRPCEAAIGVRTRSLTKVRQGADVDGQGRVTGGRDIWVCATCLARGVLTQVTS